MFWYTSLIIINSLVYANSLRFDRYKKNIVDFPDISLVLDFQQILYCFCIGKPLWKVLIVLFLCFRTTSMTIMIDSQDEGKLRCKLLPYIKYLIIMSITIILKNTGSRVDDPLVTSPLPPPYNRQCRRSMNKIQIQQLYQTLCLHIVSIRPLRKRYKIHMDNYLFLYIFKTVLCMKIGEECSENCISFRIFCPRFVFVKIENPITIQNYNCLGLFMSSRLCGVLVVCGVPKTVRKLKLKIIIAKNERKMTRSYAHARTVGTHIDFQLVI